MKKILALVFAGFMGFANTSKAEIKLNPYPQSVKENGDSIQLTGSFRVYGFDDIKSNIIKNVIDNYRINEDGILLRIGTKDSESIKKFKKKIPNCKEGYYLSVKDNEIVIAGYDNRGLFYGLQTMKLLIDRNSVNDRGNILLPEVEIVDWPDVAVRGVVEGFYGQPWSHSARMKLIDFYSKYKLNTYIYGPKNDSYHSTPKWREPYPNKEAEQLKELVSYAKEKEVDFVWAIHPGRDIKWTEEDRDKLIYKFESMYDLGVRAFAVFFDDISGKGTDAEMQVKLLNYINKNFIKRKGDIAPLIMCPTEYNRSRRKVETHYLETLGDKLDSDIHIMWTGDRALSDITYENLKWIQELIKRNPYIWWNYPVTDFSNDRILMGEVYGVDPSIKTETSGFVSNPMEYPESSKLALYSIAGYTWNIDSYNAKQSWQESIEWTLPDASEALECLATHSSATGVEHFPRKESENIKLPAECFLNNFKKDRSWNENDFNDLYNEFVRMKTAADELDLSESNEDFISEIHPWIVSLDLWSQMGLEVLELAKAIRYKNTLVYNKKLRHLKILESRIEKNNLKVAAGSATLGTSVIKPFIEEIMKISIE